MPRPSLRSLLLVVSVVFAMFVVGGVALTTYVIVTNGSREAAYTAAERNAAITEALVRETLITAEIEAATEGLTGEERAEETMARFKRELPSLVSRVGLEESGIALYSADGALYWASLPDAIRDGQSEERLRALASGKAVTSVAESGSLGSGLFGQADLGHPIVHVPVPLPGGEVGVLDVAYTPNLEERIIDAIRPPMAILALVAMLVMVVLMQTSMVWVLGLVRDLRKAADSIDAGRLDERLPVGAENEIGELANSLNRLIERLQRRSEAQGRFVADASHELATPVAGIRGYTSILRAWGAEDPTVREEAIDAIDRESKRMSRLTSDLLNLLHADEGLRLKSEKFDLNALARERLATVASRYLDKDLEFVGPDQEPFVLVGDPGRVEDVIAILLDNAAKYTPEGGRVSLQTQRRRDTAAIIISDTGKGIPAEELPRIFDRFFRSERARAGGEAGFGLGLAIADSIIKSMGGTITAESIVGEGTTFTIVLPRRRIG